MFTHEQRNVITKYIMLAAICLQHVLYATRLKCGHDDSIFRTNLHQNDVTDVNHALHWLHLSKCVSIAIIMMSVCCRFNSIHGTATHGQFKHVNSVITSIFSKRRVLLTFPNIKFLNLPSHNVAKG